MKLNLKSFFAGALAMALIGISTVAFAENSATIEAIFGRVRLVVNGSPVYKETLLYNGTTYLPIRAVAEVLAMEVEWDGEQNIATLTSTGDAPNVAALSTEDAMFPNPTGFYKAFPEVPDLGATINREPIMVKQSGGMFMYSYIALACSDEAMAQWITLLEAQGFEYEGESDMTGGSLYASNTHLVTMAYQDEGQLLTIVVCGY